MVLDISGRSPIQNSDEPKIQKRGDLMRVGKTNMVFREKSSALLAVIFLVIMAGCATRPNTLIQGDFADSDTTLCGH